MGLDIRAYSKVKPVDKSIVDKSISEDDFDGFHIGNHEDFSRRAEPFPDGRYDGNCELDFREFYGRYNFWREKLAELAGYAAVGNDHHKHSRSAWNANEGKFWELICFTDCDGTIGTVAAKKLLKDFEELDVSQQDDQFKGTYENFKKACRIASNDGAILFT